MTAETAPALNAELLALLRSTAICYVATTMPDGSPQLTQTWVDLDPTGTHVLINTVLTHQKTRNLARDPRIAVAISDAANPSRYHEIRGRVVASSTEGATEHIERLSLRYTGAPYPWYGGRDQQRVILTITPGRIHTMG